MPLINTNGQRQRLAHEGGFVLRYSRNMAVGSNKIKNIGGKRGTGGVCCWIGTRTSLLPFVSFLYYWFVVDTNVPPIMAFVSAAAAAAMVVVAWLLLCCCSLLPPSSFLPSFLLGTAAVLPLGTAVAAAAAAAAFGAQRWLKAVLW